jgi:hypothetical protein
MAIIENFDSIAIVVEQEDSVAYTKCPDQSCPLKSNCVRFDNRAHFGDSGCFGNSPRSRDNCQFFFPHDHTGPRPGKPEGNPPPALNADWPTEKDMKVIE